MELFSKLTKDIIVHENQGYALYFYHNGKTLEKVNSSFSYKHWFSGDF